MPPAERPHDVTEGDRIAAAQQYVRGLRVFYAHAGVAAASLTVIVVVNLATNLAAGITGEWSAWWSGWVLLGWSPGLFVHGLVVRLQRPTSDASSWEQRQIDKLLAR